VIARKRKQGRKGGKKGNREGGRGETEREGERLREREIRNTQFQLLFISSSKYQMRPDKWIKKMWCLYTMEFYSAIEKNEILSFAGKWIELEYIILSEVSQVQNDKGHIFSHIGNIDLIQAQAILCKTGHAKGVSRMAKEGS
jgi:hypothetical protein